MTPKELVTYERIDGGVVHPRWRGREIPVCPKWVRDQTGIRSRYQYATLAKEEAERFPAGVRETLVEYLKNWPEHRQRGEGLLIAGDVSRQRRLWAGAALMNEIVMRWGPRSPVRPWWLSMGRGILALQDARARTGEDYFAMRNRTMDATILLVDDLTQIPEDKEGYFLAYAILEHRFDDQLPTILTLDVSEGWDAAKKRVGRSIMEFATSGNIVLEWNSKA